MPSHRDLSLTGWIVNGMTSKTMLDLRAAFDEAFKINAATAYPTRISPELYERAKREGFNMAGYRYELPPDRVPVFLSPVIYEAARLQNIDMTGFAKQEMLPLIIEHPMPTSAQRRDRIREDVAAGRLLGANHVGKFKSPARQCSGKEIPCLPGRGGACTGCADEE